LSQFVLRAKQAKWQARETGRLRESNADLKYLEELLESRLEEELNQLQERLQSGELGQTGYDEERKGVEKESEERRKRIRESMRVEGQTDTQERVSRQHRIIDVMMLTQSQVVPDYLIDCITFEIMHDPVITPSGASYERVGLMKHLKATGLDPLTREPLSEKHLYPNVALRNACSEFIDSNGWAVDF
jgi:STIP1 homology and U-box containing protein 1